MNTPVFSSVISAKRKTGSEKFLNNGHFSDLRLQQSDMRLGTAVYKCSAHVFTKAPGLRRYPYPRLF